MMAKVKLKFDGDRCLNGPYALQRRYYTEGGRTYLEGVAGMVWESRRERTAQYWPFSQRDTKKEAIADCQRHFDEAK